jgi:hypothetical protein
MTLPIALTVAYLAINFAIMLWLERERAHGRTPARRVAVLAAMLRYGPPVVGLVYLVTIAGDWLFFLFVIGFFAANFWMMDGVLGSTNTQAKGPEPMRSGWDDRGSKADRERS